MAEFSITGDDWTFELGSSYEVPEMATDEGALPWVQDPECWRQYQNPDVYEFDSLVRKWIAECSRNWEWKHSYKKRRYTMGMIVEQIYGRKWNPKDSARSHMFAKILAYYSSRIQKETYISGKKVRKTVYTISPNRLSKPPYSLRLRLEWLAERGEVPNRYNMKLPKDDLKKGHARNPKTDENMEKRRQKAREVYNRRYNRK